MNNTPTEVTLCGADPEDPDASEQLQLDAEFHERFRLRHRLGHGAMGTV